MLKIETGCLDIDTVDLDIIQQDICNGTTPIEALQKRMDIYGLQLKDVYEMRLRMDKYRELTCILAAELMNYHQKRKQEKKKRKKVR